MDAFEIYQLVHFQKSKTYFSEEKLDYDVELYKNAIDQFIDDYRRWYDGEVIDIHRLNITPQLHPVLTYRLARLLYLKGNEEQASVYSVLERIPGLVEIYYSAQIGRGLKINLGAGCVIGVRCVIGDNCLRVLLQGIETAAGRLLAIMS